MVPCQQLGTQCMSSSCAPGGVRRRNQRLEVAETETRRPSPSRQRPKESREHNAPPLGSAPLHTAPMPTCPHKCRARKACARSWRRRPAAPPSWARRWGGAHPRSPRQRASSRTPRGPARHDRRHVAHDDVHVVRPKVGDLDQAATAGDWPKRRTDASRKRLEGHHMGLRRATRSLPSPRTPPLGRVGHRRRGRASPNNRSTGCSRRSSSRARWCSPGGWRPPRLWSTS